MCGSLGRVNSPQRRPTDDDERVMLFVMMKPGRHFTHVLANDIKAAIRRELTPRHVPKYIFETPEIPVSINSVANLYNNLAYYRR